MKKSFLKIVTFAMVVILCVFCGVASAENSFLMDVRLDSPKAYTLEETAGVPDDLKAESFEAKLSALEIICPIIPDPDGYLVYRVHYTLSSGVIITGINSGEEPAFTVWPHDYRIYDMYTGKLIESGDYSEIDEGYTAQKATKIDEEVTVERKSTYKITENNKSYDADKYTQSFTFDCTEILKVPATYDGILFGVNKAPLKASFYESADYGDSSGFWNDEANKDNWEFIKISENKTYESITPGSEKYLIIELQRLLGLEMDGTYGEGTENAVVALQDENGFEKDGKNANHETLSKLLEKNQ